MPRTKNVIYQNNLKQHMQENDITISTLSKMSGISYNAIKCIRQHKQEPIRYTSKTLCKALGIEESKLFPRNKAIGPSRYHCGNKYVKVALKNSA